MGVSSIVDQINRSHQDTKTTSPFPLKVKSFKPSEICLIKYNLLIFKQVIKCYQFNQFACIVSRHVTTVAFTVVRWRATLYANSRAKIYY